MEDECLLANPTIPHPDAPPINVHRNIYLWAEEMSGWMDVQYDDDDEHN